MTTETTALEYHDFANIFPLIGGEALDELRESVRLNGVINPIVLYDGKILDGRNRYVCARNLGIECPTVTYEGDDPLGHVVALNPDRRHLSESQRAMVAGRHASMGPSANQR